MPLCLCKRRCASFGYKNDKIRRWCRFCKPDDAIDLKNRTCFCGKVASYGLKSDKIMQWCKTCAPEFDEVVNLRNPKAKLPNKNEKWMSNIALDGVKIECSSITRAKTPIEPATLQDFQHALTLLALADGNNLIL